MRAGEIGIEFQLRAQLLPGLRSITVDEVARSHAFLTFQLYFQNFQPTFSASDKQMITLSEKVSGNERTLSQGRIPNVQVLSAKSGEDARPRLKPAHAIADFLCGESKVDSAIFFGQNGREGCLRVILRTGFDSACLQPAQGFDYKIRADRSQRRCQSLSRIGC